ncbi:hypothetical protein YC2023_012186 [Brassica napus]
MLRHQNGRRSPTSSSDSPLHLGPEYEDGEAPATATEERETGESRGGDNPVEERQRRSRHDLALSPETLGTHPKIDLVTGSGRNPVKTREGEAKRRLSDRILTGRGLDTAGRSGGGDRRDEAHRRPPEKIQKRDDEGKGLGERENRERNTFSHLSLYPHDFLKLETRTITQNTVFGLCNLPVSTLTCHKFGRVIPIINDFVSSNTTERFLFFLQQELTLKIRIVKSLDPILIHERAMCRGCTVHVKSMQTRHTLSVVLALITGSVLIQDHNNRRR